MFDYLVVGAGFAGSVLAERLARVGRKRVLVVDRRPHIGGNAYDEIHDSGILHHRYGPHIFHTNSQTVFAYLSRFTRWRRYEHRVLSSVSGELLPFPINLSTLNRLYGIDLTTETAMEFLTAVAEPVREVRNAEEQIVSQVGWELYRTFFEGYTRKQWGMDPRALPRSVTARIPVRTSADDRYFTDTYQGIPSPSYSELFRKLLDHPLVEVLVDTDFREVEGRISFRKLIYTGAIDEFFDYRFGKLPYRSLSFRHEVIERTRFQPVAQVNYPGSEPYTRITEHKHLTGQEHPHTLISYEVPQAEGDPYYPIPTEEAQELYRRYAAYAEARTDTLFLGRLGTFRYYNMDQVVAQALKAAERLLASEGAQIGAVA